jgi:hypothetical protein
MTNVDVAWVAKKLQMSHLFPVVVWVGAVPPDHSIPVPHDNAPAVALGLQTVSTSFCPATYPLKLIVVAAVPMRTSCWLPFLQSIVMLVDVASVFSATTNAPPEPILNCAHGEVVPTPTLSLLVMVNAFPVTASASVARLIRKLPPEDERSQCFKFEPALWSEIPSDGAVPEISTFQFGVDVPTPRLVSAMMLPEAGAPVGQLPPVHT